MKEHRNAYGKDTASKAITQSISDGPINVVAYWATRFSLMASTTHMMELAENLKSITSELSLFRNVELLHNWCSMA